MHEYLSYLAGRFNRVLENFESAVRLQEASFSSFLLLLLIIIPELFFHIEIISNL